MTNKKAFFGLPSEVLYCKKCVISNQRPSSTVEFSHKKNEMQSVVSFSKVKDHPFWCFELENGIMKKYINKQEKHLQSQELPPMYVTNGAFYLITPDNFRKHESFYKGSIIPLIIDDHKESLDIDTEWDWEVAEMICSQFSV